MALIRWEPAREIGTIQSEMNRLFNTFFDTPTSVSNRATFRRWIPAMDLGETEGDYVLKADLPGLSESDVKIEVEDNVLTISGERKAEHEERKDGYYRIERSSGSFERTFRVPEGIVQEGRACLPKSSEARRAERKITVRAGGSLPFRRS